MTDDEIFSIFVFVLVGVIIGMALIVLTAHFFGCHAAMGDICNGMLQ